jgi:hypothetical protein
MDRETDVGLFVREFKEPAFQRSGMVFGCILMSR